MRHLARSVTVVCREACDALVVVQAHITLPAPKACVFSADHTSPLACALSNVVFAIKSNFRGQWDIAAILERLPRSFQQNECDLAPEIQMRKLFCGHPAMDQPSGNHRCVQAVRKQRPPPFLGTDDWPIRGEQTIKQVHSSHSLIVFVNTVWLRNRIQSCFPPTSGLLQRFVEELGRCNVNN